MVAIILGIALFGSNLMAQENPTPRLPLVRIVQRPRLELVRDGLTIIRWATNNPGGSPVHYGIVRYGTGSHELNQTATSPIRLNPDYAWTVFRVRLENLKPHTTYYYSVDSKGTSGSEDEVPSQIRHFTTP